MRPIHITMAAIAGLSLAAPASAQWGHPRTYSQQLRVQIDAGISHGTISRRESVSLREDLGRLVRLERRFSPNGINGRERAQLMQRSAALSQDIRVASREHNRRDNHPQTWDSGSANGRWVPDARFAGLHPSDRFSGDARIGQRVNPSTVNLPPEYRSQYVDDARVYYGYDNGRIYQIDRQSQMILALLDLPR
jgi:hypothetical protein